MIARLRLNRRGRIGVIFACGAPVFLAHDVALAPRGFTGRDVASLAIGTCGTMLMLWGIHRWDGVRPSRMRMAGWTMLLFALELSWGIAPLWGIVGLGVLPILPAKFSRPDMTHEACPPALPWRRAAPVGCDCGDL
jgi:hypothetical protein